MSGAKMATAAKVSPAPWKTHLVDSTLIVDAKGRLVASTHQDEEDYAANFDAREGDARLIAASPEMLLMLVHLVHWHDQLSPADIAKAKALIAKATGA